MAEYLRKIISLFIIVLHGDSKFNYEIMWS